MRRLASFLLSGFVLTAGATEVWRWTDENGVVHLSDRPTEGAERIQITDAVAPATPFRTVPAPSVAGGESSRGEGFRPSTVPYTSCKVVSPENDMVFHAVDSVPVALLVEPAVQAGHRIRVMLNGEAVADWPAEQSSYTLTGLYRGSYTIAVRIVDAAGRSYCNGPASSFHVRQPSVLSPARQGR